MFGKCFDFKMFIQVTIYYYHKLPFTLPDIMYSGWKVQGSAASFGKNYLDIDIKISVFIYTIL